MAFEKKQLAATTRQAKDFSGAPAYCKCGSDAVVALATVVHNKSGKKSTGSASEFCGRDNNNNPNWILQDWWNLLEYRGYCTDCYEGIPEAGPRKYNDRQVRFAWLWLMGEISSKSGSLGRLFKPVRLTDAQRDTAIEIVNYEAHRAHQPDAIPEEFRLPEVLA